MLRSDSTKEAGLMSLKPIPQNPDRFCVGYSTLEETSVRSFDFRAKADLLAPVIGIKLRQVMSDGVCHSVIPRKVEEWGLTVPVRFADRGMS
jgi:hypothetical protein